MKRTALVRKTPLRQVKAGTPASAQLLKKAFGSRPKKMRARAANNPGWYGWAVENVWNKRPHACEVCGAALGFFGERPDPIVFSHLLPRSSYRKYKTDVRNVVIKCPNCHKEWHACGPELLSYESKWRKTTDLYYTLRNEANGITP